MSRRDKTVILHHYDVTPSDAADEGIRIPAPSSFNELLDIASEQFGTAVKYIMRPSGDTLTGLYALPAEAHLFVYPGQSRPLQPPAAGFLFDAAPAPQAAAAAGAGAGGGGSSVQSRYSQQAAQNAGAQRRRSRQSLGNIGASRKSLDASSARQSRKSIDASAHGKNFLTGLLAKQRNAPPPRNAKLGRSISQYAAEDAESAINNVLGAGPPHTQSMMNIGGRSTVNPDEPGPQKSRFKSLSRLSAGRLQSAQELRKAQQIGSRHSSADVHRRSSVDSNDPMLMSAAAFEAKVAPREHAASAPGPAPSAAVTVPKPLSRGNTGKSMEEGEPTADDNMYNMLIDIQQLVEINFHSLPQELADMFDKIQTVLDAKDKEGHNPYRKQARQLEKQLNEAQQKIKMLSEKENVRGGMMNDGKAEEVESLRSQLAQAKAGSAELTSARDEIASLREQLRAMSQQDGDERLAAVVAQCEAQSEAVQAGAARIAALEKQLEDSQKKVEHLKICHEAEVMRNSRSSGQSYDELPSPAAATAPLPNNDEKLRETIRELESRVSFLQTDAQSAHHERELTLQNMEDLQKRYDKKNALLEAEAKRVMTDAAEAQQKLAVLRRETDSLRPKLATLDLLQPKVDRLTVQNMEKDERIKELTRLNEELMSSQRSSKTKSPTLPSRSPTSPSQSPSTPSTPTTAPPPSPARKAFLMVGEPTSPASKSPEPISRAMSGDEDLLSMDGCSWLAEAQGLLSKMNQTRWDFNDMTEPLALAAKGLNS